MEWKGSENGTKKSVDLSTCVIFSLSLPLFSILYQTHFISQLFCMDEVEAEIWKDEKFMSRRSFKSYYIKFHEHSNTEILLAND